MANTKISALTSVTSLVGTDTFPVVQGTSTLVTRKAAISDVVTIMPHAGLRNMVHNGNFTIDQRGNAATHSVSTASYLYYLDRWFSSIQGAAITGQVVSGSGTSRFNYRLTGAVGNTGFTLGQRIESININHLASAAAILQFKVASNALTTLTYTVSYANTVDAHGTLSSPTTTTIVTGTVPVTATLTRQTVSFNLPANAVNGVQINFSGGALVATQTFTFADIQLEAGSVATPFETRPHNVEMALCQRYINGFTTSTYDAAAATGTTTVANGYNISTTNSLFNIPFNVHLRKRPTGVVTHTSLASTNVVNGSNVSGLATVIANASSGTQVGQINVTNVVATPTLVAGQGSHLTVNNASAAQFILFTGAEL